MLAAQRKDLILTTLREVSGPRWWRKDLAAELDLSEDTIRRDLRGGDARHRPRAAPRRTSRIARRPADGGATAIGTRSRVRGQPDRVLARPPGQSAPCTTTLGAATPACAVDLVGDRCRSRSSRSAAGLQAVRSLAGDQRTGVWPWLPRRRPEHQPPRRRLELTTATLRGGDQARRGPERRRSGLWFSCLTEDRCRSAVRGSRPLAAVTAVSRDDVGAGPRGRRAARGVGVHAPQAPSAQHQPGRDARTAAITSSDTAMTTVGHAGRPRARRVAEPVGYDGPRPVVGHLEAPQPLERGGRGGRAQRPGRGRPARRRSGRSGPSGTIGARPGRGGRPVQQLGRDHARGVQVLARVGRGAGRLLGRHVAVGADHRRARGSAARPRPAPRRRSRRAAGTARPVAGRLEQQVGGLHVAVHDAGGVHRGERLEQLVEQQRRRTTRAAGRSRPAGRRGSRRGPGPCRRRPGGRRRPSRTA